VLELDPESPWIEDENPDLDSLKREIMKEFAVIVDAAVIYMTLAVAAESGLFGLLCDAPVQLVDTTDTGVLLR
jgi:hypothetical protein